MKPECDELDEPQVKKARKVITDHCTTQDGTSKASLDSDSKEKANEDRDESCISQQFGSKSVILLDIEGTTTSISFVKDELFPYITKHVKSYLTKNYDDPTTQEDIEALRQLAKEDLKSGVSDVVPILSADRSKVEIIDSVVANVHWQMSLDRKTTALKQLQGHMWQKAYQQQEVQGHLYPDVTENLQKWKKLGKSICIYSSGSVAAQKLLFTHSIDGDLTPYISDHFDTKVGGKRESASYGKISQLLNVKPDQVLFLTDVIEEAQAAQEAGMTAIIMIRPGNKPYVEDLLAGYHVFKTFHEVQLQPNHE